jgi:hypothetical protein
MKRIPVLCCCDPSNEIGTAPDNLPYEKRVWVDEDGNEGVAYPSRHHGEKCNQINWFMVKGFIGVSLTGNCGKKKGGGKGGRKPKKTWKEKGGRRKKR